MKIFGPAEAYRAASISSSKNQAASSAPARVLPAAVPATKTDRVSVSENFLTLQADSPRAPASPARIAQLKLQFDSDALVTSPEATAAKLLADEQDSFAERTHSRG